jgi:medium-chain acyl-[acyl-carrier-protein] hydrolase
MPSGDRRRSVSRWWRVVQEGPDATLRLFCFPYAGGNASTFQKWAGRLPPDVAIYAIQLPGRVNRLKEPPFTRIPPLVEVLSAELLPLLDRPFALFGHSLGALVSFEIARQLARSDRTPRHLFVSGRRAPYLDDQDAPRYLQNDEDFLATLHDLQGTPPELLEHAELLELMLPTLRADFELAETYRYAEGPPLRCPITVFGGRDDEESEGDRLEAWRVHTTERFAVHMLEGDHFSIQTSADDLLRRLGADLAPAQVMRGTAHAS